MRETTEYSNNSKVDFQKNYQRHDLLSVNGMMKFQFISDDKITRGRTASDHSNVEVELKKIGGSNEYLNYIKKLERLAKNVTDIQVDEVLLAFSSMRSQVYQSELNEYEIISLNHIISVAIMIIEDAYKHESDRLARGGRGSRDGRCGNENRWNEGWREIARNPS